MNSKKIVISVTVCLIGMVCLVCYYLSFNSKSAGIILSDDKEESVLELSDVSDLDIEVETSVDLGNSVKEQSPEEQTYIAVHVCGQVKHPGVYTLTKGARVSDAIEAAGGLTKEAAGDFINQAQKLEDEQQVYVPNKEEAKEMPTGIQQENGSNESHSVNKGLININQATREELMTLPGIGQAKADMIIRYREEHGRFATIEEIKNISGIKDGVYNKICDLITTD